MSSTKRCVAAVLFAALAACSAPMTPADDAAALDASAVDALPDAPPDANTSAPDAAADAAVDARAEAGCGLCAEYGPIDGQGRWRTTVLREVSGLAASAAHPGIFWAHNDSGDSARLFAVRASGEVVGEYAIDGAGAVDWEDIAVAPCADGGGSCVVIGDVGDNPSTRASVDLYRVREPATLESSGNLQSTRFRVRYPMGAMNCEAMVVDRRDGASAMLIEKTDRSSLRLVRVDLTGAGGEQMGEELGTVPSFGNLVTAADAHPCAPALIVRTYATAWEMRGAPGDSLAQIARAPRVERQTAAEVQGEAIAYLSDGRGYLTATEGVSSLITAVFCR